MIFILKIIKYKMMIHFLQMTSVLLCIQQINKTYSKLIVMNNSKQTSSRNLKGVIFIQFRKKQSFTKTLVLFDFKTRRHESATDITIRRVGFTCTIKIRITLKISSCR
jgi:hypothetical protein